MKYAVIDIETTGGNPKREKITEIAIYIFDGEKITDEYTTLVNPERHIPEYIQRLTGITNEMVSKSPKFYEIAKNIVEITEGCCFVAHNAGFDYNFVKEEFKSLGFDYQREYLCTVKLSRKIIPGYRSYSLGNITKELGIKIENRHRAAGDARATVELLRHLIGKVNMHDISDIEIADVLKNTHTEFNKTALKQLPEKTGVYYFINNKQEIIYVGKSIDIKKRVYSHFANKKSVRAMEMKSEIVDISYEETGSELVALLLESEEVKRIMPKYNRMLRRSLFSWGLYSETDTKGYHHILLKRITQKNGNPILMFQNKKEAEKALYTIIEKYELCQQLCGLYKGESGCFHYQIGMCKGACAGKESPNDYNKRVEEFINRIEIPNKSMFIIDKGRHKNEKSVVKIEQGIYKGFGYAEAENITFIDELHDIIKPAEDNRDARTILKNFINGKKYEKIIPIQESYN